MTQVLANNLKDVMKYRETIFTFLVCSIFILFASYIYFVHEAVTNVVAREQIVKENRALATNVSELEGKYFIVKNTISMELAHEKGFVAGEVSSFISSKSLTAMANHNEL